MTFNNGILHKPFLFFISCILWGIATAQDFIEKKYPHGYFIYPIGAKDISLAANFGELRPDHFHMGLDCKTDHRENLPVYAAADGYISRVKIEPFGFGRAIYIDHPNGFTTLYAHLNEFYPELEAYVKEEQYKLQSWQIFIHIPKRMFPVKQHQLIAHSGNTGGSQGPHTHFEIRDTKSDRNLNPLLFGLPIPDHVAPVCIALEIFDRDKSTYGQKPRILPLIKSGSGYSPMQKDIVITSHKVSFAINAFDQLSNSTNHNGIYEAILYDNNKSIVGFKLDNISYDETRYVNGSIDYKTKQSGGAYYQHLSKLAGVPEGFFKEFSGDGIIDLHDRSVHHILIKVKDANGNESHITFNISGNEHRYDNHPQQKNGNSVEFEPMVRNIFENEQVTVITDEKAVYDSFEFKVIPAIGEHGADVYNIGSALIPLHTFATFKLKPTYDIPANEQDRIVMIRRWKAEKEVVKAIKEGEKYTAQFRNFGEFELAVDMEPPVIKASFDNGANLSMKQSIYIIVKDNNEQVKNFKATLDGKWLRFTNDKEKAFIYQFDEHCLKGEHVLKISVQDEAGNTSTKTLTFTR